MARVAPRTPVNGRSVPRKPVSHAKPPEDDETEGDDDQDVAVSPGDDIPAGRPPADALSEMLASLQGATTSRITVYRVVKNQPQSYVFECDPASFSLDDLRDKYNGGEFRLYVSKDGRLFKNMRVVVEPKQMPHHADHIAPASGMSDVLAVMRDGFAAQAAAVREAMGARSGPSPFSNMDIPAVISAVAAAVTALRPPAPPPPPDNTSTVMDAFMRGIEIATGLRESAAPADNSIGGMLRDVLKSPLMAAVVQQAATPTPPAQVPVQRLPSPPQSTIPAQSASQQQVSHAKPAEQITVDQETQMLAHYLGFLTQKAKSGADPALYADIVLDNVPDQQLTELLNKGDGLLDYLVQVCPPVGDHREWFASMLESINGALSEEQPESPNATDTEASLIPGDAA